MLSSSAAPSCRRVVVDQTNLQTAPESGELLVGSSAAIRRLRMQIERIAPHFRSVLIRGDRGTRKEYVARMLHAIGGGAAGRFLELDADTIEASREAGSRFGRYLEGADQATVFLNGVDGLSLQAQDWLLKTLDCEKSLRRLQTDIKMRVIASTTQDLLVLASTGRFRQALYQWIATVEITVPPLRERTEDIPDLARYFVDRFARLHDKSVRGIREEAIVKLQNYSWPGDVGELCDVIQDGVVSCNADFMELNHLIFAEATGAEELETDAGASVRLEDVVVRHVLGVLKGCGGNKLRAAEMLGISRSTLYRMLETGSSTAVLR